MEQNIPGEGWTQQLNWTMSGPEFFRMAKWVRKEYVDRQVPGLYTTTAWKYQLHKQMISHLLSKQVVSEQLSLDI